MNTAIRIHHFELSGHSHRVALFAELAGIEHEIVLVDLPNGEHKQAPFLALNPAGQVPVIEDNNVVVSDSNAILVYLARKYAPTWLPTEPHLEAEVQKFLTLAAGEQAYGPAAARLNTVFNANFDIDFTHALAHRYLARIDQHLKGRDFLVGDAPTIADVALYSYTAHAPEGNVSLDAYPNVLRWLASIEGLQGFKAMPTTKAGLLA
ncbi:glutathione S-transferase family protein [Granulosicoccus sp. 3-233]|uniref:glutathione S-transferase family protein n=1 Tax=Granulosicoccus sp. 3-233 TaxID=3417969 RepID=UPI003D33752F